MSGLYLQAEADKKRPFSKTAKTNFRFRVMWGEKSELKLAADIEVSWPRNQLLPKITVRHPASIKMEEAV